MRTLLPLIIGVLLAACGSPSVPDGGIPIAIDEAAVGAPVPDDFLGLSVEWSHVNDYLGDGAGHLRPETVALLSRFQDDGHQVGLRIGGNSEDQAVWNPDGGTLPQGAKVSLDGSQHATLKALREAVGTRYVLGLNLSLKDVAHSEEVVRAARTALGDDGVVAYELGNEPDLYGLNGYRSLNYGAASYRAELHAELDRLAPFAPGRAVFAAPAVYGESWLGDVGPLLAAEQGRVGLVTVHRYPYDVCFGKPAPPLRALFTGDATAKFGTLFSVVVRAAAGVPVRVAELNSVSCGGAAGVSDTFAAGLWAADVMFRLASIGVSGVNLHTPGRHYAVWDYTGDGTLEVRGLYYGMLLFSRVTARHGRIVPVSIGMEKDLRAFATVGDDGVLRVAVLNESVSAAYDVRLAPSGHHGSATVERLFAASADTGTDITFAGQTWKRSSDGTPAGARTREPAPIASNGLLLSLQPAAAVLVSFE